MLYHENIENYYVNNFNALFMSENIGMMNNFRLDDFEQMLPFERELYMTLMRNKIKEINDHRKGSK